MSLRTYPYPTPAGEMALLRLPLLNPEDVLLDPEGRLLCGLEDGSILRLNSDGTNATVLVNTGGRPLGLDWLPDGRLLVCDCERGLLAIDIETQSIEVLIKKGHHQNVMLCNKPAVAQDGTIYFSDSSQRYPLSNIRTEIIEHIPTGRLLRRHIDGSIEVLMEQLHFANGVVLSADESFVLVAETGACKINRVWLKGARKGQIDVFADQLPGMPDNMSLGSDGLFWVALPSATDQRLSMVHRLPFLIRRTIAKIPDELQPAEKRNFLVMAFDQHGNCVHFIEADPLRYHLVTGVREHNGYLYAGSVEENAIAVIRIPHQNRVLH